MAFVTLTNISVLDNPTAFLNPFQFEVTFECIHQLEDDLEWKITYVGSADNETHDQVLEEVLVGPVPMGTNKFVFQANAPNPALIPDEDKIGVTVVLVTCSYREKEFVRVGYYVNNAYTDPEWIENPPAQVDVSKLQRNILADKPRVTRFPIDWTSSSTDQPVEDMTFDAKSLGIENVDMSTEVDLLKVAEDLDNDQDDLIIGGTNDEMMLQDDEEEEEDNEMEMEFDDPNVEIDLETTF